MEIAIVTGASSWIGEAFLKEIAQQNEFDKVWMVARREDRLEAIRTKLGEKFEVLCADITTSEGIEKISKKLLFEKPEVKLLINCAGMGKRGDVETNAIDAMKATLEINCVALTQMAGIVIPYMKGEGKSAIINIASSAAFLPQPGFAIYAASKSYVLSLSRALSYELKKYNISVTAVCPGPVETEFLSKATDNKESEFTGFRKFVVVGPEKLAKSSLKASKAGRKVLVYGFSQKCLHLAAKIVPTDLILKIETM